MSRNFFGLLVASSLLLACGNSDHRTVNTIPVEPPLDPQLASVNAKAYLDALIPPGQYGGPICLPETVINNMTQCSYSLNGGTEIGTILCGNSGCYEGEAPRPLDQNLVGQPTAAAVTPGVSHSGIQTEELLLWYLLFNNGAVTHHYYDWHYATPAAYRSVYFTPLYRPPVTSINYYHTTYSAPVRSSSTQRFSNVTTSSLSRRPTSVTSSTTSRTSPTTSSRTTVPVKSPTVAPVPKTTTPVTVPRPTSVAPRTVPTVPRPVPVASPRPAMPRPVAPAPRPVPKRSTGFGTPTRRR